MQAKPRAPRRAPQSTAQDHVRRTKTRRYAVPPVPVAPTALRARRSPSRTALVDLPDHREDLTAADHAEQLAVRDHLDRLVGGEHGVDSIANHGVGSHLW